MPETAPTLRLLPIDEALALAIRHSDPASVEGCLISLGPSREVALAAVDQTLLWLQTTPPNPELRGGLAVEADSGFVVGTCAFVGRPSNGEIEIAYNTFPPHEGRGVGRAMAQSLIDLARRSGRVARVVAHTAPEFNASTAILQRLGFERDGVFIDQDIGEAWRWRLDLGA